MSGRAMCFPFCPPLPPHIAFMPFQRHFGSLIRLEKIQSGEAFGRLALSTLGRFCRFFSMLVLSGWLCPSPETAQAQWFRRFRRPSYSQPYRPPQQYSRPQTQNQRPPTGNYAPQRPSVSPAKPAVPSRPAQPLGTAKTKSSSFKTDVRDWSPDQIPVSGFTISGSRLASQATSDDQELAVVRMPGEFEPQKAIMLSVSDWMPHHFDILIEIATKTAGHVDLLVYYNDLTQLYPVISALNKAQIPGDHVWFAPLKMDTIWLRDFGPRVGESDQGPVSVDFFYEGSRPLDDSFPQRWARDCETTLRTVRWTAQGGNLAFNGRGVGVASNRIFKDNAIDFPMQYRPRDPRAEARRMVTREFKRACNLSELVILEPLQNEITRHVDMFMTFIQPDHVLVGQLDRRVDPVNAAILDRNARALSQVNVDGKPLRVSRIGFPPRNGKEWSSYTNIIMANGLILLPKFDSDPPQLTAAAKATYERLIPGCTVETVNLTSMKSLQGALHCLSMNLPEFAPLPPKRYPYEAFRKQLDAAN